MRTKRQHAPAVSGTDCWRLALRILSARSGSSGRELAVGLLVRVGQMNLVILFGWYVYALFSEFHRGPYGAVAWMATVMIAVSVIVVVIGGGVILYRTWRDPDRVGLWPFVIATGMPIAAVVVIALLRPQYSFRDPLLKLTREILREIL